MFKIYDDVSAIQEGTHILTCDDLVAAEREATRIAMLTGVVPVILFESISVN